MSRLRRALDRLLHPPAWVTAALPLPVFAGTAWVLAQGMEGAAAYAVYALAFYTLAILCAAVPRALRRLRESAAVRRARETRYLRDRVFRAGVGLYPGTAANFAYALFRGVTGALAGSVWSLSLAAYHLVLGSMRVLLLLDRRSGDAARERRGYRRTAWLLLLLDLPMGGIAAMTVVTDAGYHYPGYAIYVSAIYTFYMAALAAVNFARFRRLGSPALSAAKAISLASAAMGMLGLQTAMIAAFSPGDARFRTAMNAATGGAVFAGVAALALAMLLRSGKRKEDGA